MMLAPVQIAGLVFGASGTFPYFQSCFQAWQFISTMRKFGKDAADFEARLLVEEHRLMLWGRIHHLTMDRINTSHSRMARGEISDYLLVPHVHAAVERLLMTAAKQAEELKKIMARYELQNCDAGPTDPGSSTPHTAGTTAVDQKGEWPPHPLADPQVKSAVEAQREHSSDLNKKFKIGKKFLWSLHDRKAFDEALKGYKNCVASLYDITLPLHQVSLSEALGSSLSYPPPSDPVKSRLAELEPYSKVADDYPEFKVQLDALVHAWRTEAEEEGDASSMEVYKQPTFDHDGGGVISRRPCFATVGEGPSGSGRTVLIEWKGYNPNQSSTDVKTHIKTRIKTRINSVTKLLSHAPQQSKYHLLRSTGFFEDGRPTNDTINSWIGIIYELPVSPPGQPLPTLKTLRELLEDSHESAETNNATQLRKRHSVPNLGHRFHLAQKLSEFVFHIHSCGWFHKGLRPENILFFSRPKVSIEEPYIVGWEYSRKEANDEQTESMPLGDQEANLYVHPDQLNLPRPLYRREFDHYQLGCLMVEIGHWTSLRSMREKRPAATGSEEWTTRLMKMVDRLRSVMGEIYYNVTKMLLEGLDNGDWNGEFGPDVVWQLKRCHA